MLQNLWLLTSFELWHLHAKCKNINLYKLHTHKSTVYYCVLVCRRWISQQVNPYPVKQKDLHNPDNN